MRIARDFGDISQLLPEGVTLKDAPHTIFDAIRQALIYLGWQDMDEEDQPPRHIWHDEELLKEHFEAVKQRWKEKFDPNSSGAIEDPVQNAAAKDLLVG